MKEVEVVVCTVEDCIAPLLVDEPTGELVVFGAMAGTRGTVDDGFAPWLVEEIAREFVVEESTAETKSTVEDNI